MVNKRQHYVPQYYLRQFRGDGSDRVLVCLIEPFRCVGLGGIKGQCQHDHFYGKDGAIDAMLWETETAIAPALYQVNSSERANAEQWQALRLLATQLHLRTRKAAERAKIFPRYVADQVITAAIAKGELPPPKGGWHPDMMDFGGVPQTLLSLNLLACYFETTTLRCKLLKAPGETCFITSDHPAVALNRFAAETKSVRDYVGFAQSGFQLVLPLSPRLTAILYDPFVYKVGNRNDELVHVSAGDVELLNALQVQSAEKCLYAHRPEETAHVAELVKRYAKLRKAPSSGIKSFPQNGEETLVMFSDPPLVLPRPWTFCSYLAKIRRAVGERRDPAYTHLIELVVDDIQKNPGGPDLDQRIEQIADRMPETVRVARRSDPRGFQLPKSRKDWKDEGWS